MHYSYQHTVLTTNTVTNPAIKTIKLGAGKLKEVNINFPWGCAGLICCYIKSPFSQILPTNPDGFYAADDRVINAKLYHDLAEQSNVLYLIAWTLGTTNTHTLDFDFEVQGPDEPDLTTFMSALIGLMDRLITLLRSIF